MRGDEGGESDKVDVDSTEGIEADKATNTMQLMRLPRAT